MSLDDINTGKPVNTPIMINGSNTNSMNKNIYASNPNTKTTIMSSRVRNSL
jgi:hypothetical protein